MPDWLVLRNYQIVKSYKYPLQCMMKKIVSLKHQKKKKIVSLCTEKEKKKRTVNFSLLIGV